MTLPLTYLWKDINTTDELVEFVADVLQHIENPGRFPEEKLFFKSIMVCQLAYTEELAGALNEEETYKIHQINKSFADDAENIQQTWGDEALKPFIEMQRKIQNFIVQKHPEFEEQCENHMERIAPNHQTSATIVPINRAQERSNSPEPGI